MNNVAYDPAMALDEAVFAQDVVEGLVPSRGVTWLYGPSMSLKSFAVMSMAAAVATGSPWLSRATQKAVVIYVGAEGGVSLHVRRAAAERALGAFGDLVVVQEAPQLDRASGAWALRGIINAVCATLVGNTPDMFAAAKTAEYAKSPDWVAANREYIAARMQLSKFRRADKAGEVVPSDVMNAAEWQVKTEAAKREREAEKAFGRSGAAYEEAHARYLEDIGRYSDDIVPVLCVIDTYAQTSSDDARENVSTYIKNLRAIIDEASEAIDLSFVVIDHATKSGGSYLGSVAKLNDVDSQLELSRNGKALIATLTQVKSKDSCESAPLHLSARPFEVEHKGRVLSTLVVDEGQAVPKNPSLVLELLAELGGSAKRRELRDAFRAQKKGIKVTSADIAFKRALEGLGRSIVIEGDTIRSPT
jgi:RecA-family ATPase